MLAAISKSFDISSSIIFAKIVAIRNILTGDIKMPAKIPKFSHAHFRNIPENLSHIFDANLTHFLPESKIYVSTEKIMEKLSEFLAEISGGDRALLKVTSSNVIIRWPDNAFSFTKSKMYINFYAAILNVKKAFRSEIFLLHLLSKNFDRYED